jgi:hypothetical protein
MLYHVAAADPVKAFALLGEMEMEGREQAVASIVRAAKTDEERARMLGAFRSYESGLPVEERKSVSEKAFGAFADQLSDQGVDAMSKWVKAGNFNENEINGIVGSLSSRYALREPGTWIGWIGKSLSSEKADIHIREIFSEWTESDYQEVGRWLVAAPAGAVREMAVQAYAETTAEYDPQTAVQWVEKLPKGKRRDEATRRIYDEWPVDEPADVAAKEHFGIRNGLE